MLYRAAICVAAALIFFRLTPATPSAQTRPPHLLERVGAVGEWSYRLRLPMTPTTVFVALVLLIVWPSHIRSLHWWQTRSIVTDLALTPDQVTQIADLYDASAPERRRFTEMTSALMRQIQELNDADASDADLLPVTAELAQLAAAANASDQRRMRQGVGGTLRPNQQARFRRLMASGRVED